MISGRVETGDPDISSLVWYLFCVVPGNVDLHPPLVSFVPESVCEGFFVKNICRTTSHLHLHIFTSAHPHSHLYLCSSSHLHSQLHIYISAHLHLHTSTSLLMFTSAHLHLCSSSHPHIYMSAHLHILTSTSHIFTSHLHLRASPLALLNFFS